MTEAEGKHLLSEPPSNDERKQNSRLCQWAITILGVLPNVVLTGFGVLLAFLAFNTTFLYALGTHPGQVLLWALLLGGTAVLNLHAVRCCVTSRQRLLRWSAAAANSGLVLYALWAWKEWFEMSGTFDLPGASVFLAMIALSSMLAVVLARLTEPSTGWSRRLKKIAGGAFVFVTLAGLIVRPDQFSHYRDQAPVAEHFRSIGGGVGWEDWQVTSIYLKAVPITDDQLRPVCRLPELRSLYLSDTKVTDAGMAHVASARKLQGIYLDNTLVSDRGLNRIAGLTKLKNLWLRNTAVSDAGLVHLENMTEIGYLDLSGTMVTDEGLKHLTHFDQMYYLHLPGTKVTKKGIDWLHERLPICRIYGTPDGEAYEAEAHR